MGDGNARLVLVRLARDRTVRIADRGHGLAMKEVSNATAYVLLIPRLMKAGREVGYALAVHGSLARDLDLIAVPWTDDAVSAERLILHLMAEVDGRLRNGGSRKTKEDGTEEWVRANASEPSVKPHGRLAWSIHVGHEGLYIDVSVMPTGRRALKHTCNAADGSLRCKACDAGEPPPPLPTDVQAAIDALASERRGEAK